MSTNAFQTALTDFKTLLSQLRSPQRGSAPSPEQQKLATLKKNTIDQTPYTPQAQAYVQSLPMRPFGANPMSTWESVNAGANYTPYPDEPSTSFVRPPVANQYQPQGQVGFNMQTINTKQPGSTDSFPVTGLRHEFVHSMDANVNALPFVTNGPDGEGGDIQASYDPAGRWSADSNNFLAKLRSIDPRSAAYLSDMLTKSPTYGNGHPYNPTSSDTEAFAYTGQYPQGVMQNPRLAPMYQNIYYPMTKAMNYSPVYPSPDMVGMNTQE